MIGALFFLCCELAIIGGAFMHWWYKYRCGKLELQIAFDPDEMLRLDALSILGLIIAGAGFVGGVIYMLVAW